MTLFREQHLGSDERLAAPKMPGESTLPSFERPPLEELVVGVQFETPAKYSSIWSGEVWKLFQREFPYVEEQPRLQPQFETFGGGVPGSGFQFNLGPAPTRGRLWFVSADRTHLIQFQDDRLLLNWRKRPDGIPSSSPYPRFESIFSQFAKILNSLELFFDDSLDSKIEINQAEVSYVNIIRTHDNSDIGSYLNFLRSSSLEIEGLNHFFTEVFSDEEGHPFGRMSHDLQSVFALGSRDTAYQLSLTFRGTPKSNKVSDALDLIQTGRSAIVQRFALLTTESAHAEWGRTR